MSANQRSYNIIFHTHTVSGIVISVALYVIFFAGSFSFFRDEIVNWERGHTVATLDEIDLNIDDFLQDLGNDYDLYGRDIGLYHYYNERSVGISLSGSKDSTATEEARIGAFYYMDTYDKSTSTYQNAYTLGEFLYRLHFFAQIPYPVGYYISGFVAFFFLFAILTGIIVHWKKIISAFYVFRPWAKLKTIWTDAHTALGLIGFPFQLVYALTGAFFMLKAMMIAPLVLALYNGDQQKFNQDLDYDVPVFALSYDKFQTRFSIDNFVKQTKDKWRGFKITELQIFNYGDRNMHVLIGGNMPYSNKMHGIGKIIYKIDGESIAYQKDPLKNSSYLDGIKNTLFRLHLADYGGRGLRIISFLLGIISCFVILSGVMIWLVARDKKNVPEKRRRFNQKVVWWYLAICLSMYPMIAIEFLLVKWFPPAEMSFIYNTFFSGWALLSLFFFLKKDNVFTIRWTLLLGGLFGAMVPVVNGLVSGNWLWTSWAHQRSDILFVDIFWISLSGLSWIAIAVFKLKPKQQPVRPEKQALKSTVIMK